MTHAEDRKDALGATECLASNVSVMEASEKVEVGRKTQTAMLIGRFRGADKVRATTIIHSLHYGVVEEDALVTQYCYVWRKKSAGNGWREVAYAQDEEDAWVFSNGKWYVANSAIIRATRTAHDTSHL